MTDGSISGRLEQAPGLMGMPGGRIGQDRSRTAQPSVSQPDSQQTELVERVKQGDVEAFYELVRPRERGLFLSALSILRNEADAEEVAQEAILKAFRSISSFRGESKFSTWIMQIVINEARMRWRKDRKHLYDSIDEPVKAGEEGDYVPRDFADWREIPSESLQNKQLRQALQKAVDELSPKYREVVLLRDVEHLSITETAELLGITEAAVKTRLLRARLIMRDTLAPGFDGAWSKGREYQKVRPW
jgi:RNA polymerase sigma-70 factor (ECF subfamily)